MKTVMELLNAHQGVSGWKINIHNKESYELFFIKGKLETLRCTDTCDKEVTVYADHADFKGEAQFFIYPSTTSEQLQTLIDEAVEKALLINNPAYTLPAADTGDFTVESNFADFAPADLAAAIAKDVFEANDVESAALNSVEIFINKHTETILNSNGLRKSQIRYDAMVEAIPTYNGEKQSVELYEQYNFGSYDSAAVRAEIAGKMAEVKARYEAAAPASSLSCDVVLNIQEVSELMRSIARDLSYSTVYSHSNLFKKGDAIQKDPQGDMLTITATGEVKGSIRSAKFDSDGLALNPIRIVEKGQAVNYYGSNRYGQYLGETPTGSLPCLMVEGGTGEISGTYLEVVSMSGLQVDFFNDYIGGEVRLAYYCDSETITPVTGISISGKLTDVLNHIRLSTATATFGGYHGPEKAVLKEMKIF